VAVTVVVVAVVVVVDVVVVEAEMKNEGGYLSTLRMETYWLLLL